MKFTIDDAAPPEANATLKRILAVIRSLKNGQFLTARTMAAKSGISYDRFRDYSALIPKEFCGTSRTSRNKLYGNPKTVAEWEKQFQH